MSFVGQSYPDTAAIVASSARNLAIKGNVIHDVPWSGIAITDAHQNQTPSYADIEYNDIWAFNQVLQDGAGIYMDGNNLWTASPAVGSLVKNNYIHDALLPRSVPTASWQPAGT